MRIYVRTRGELRHLDYDFLGSAPPEAWWREFSDVNTMERPCLLCVRDPHGLRVFLSGVPSSRVDTVGTLIVYSLVLEDPGVPGGPAAEEQPAGSDPALAQRLIAAWTQAIPARGADRTLSDALDEAFPVDFVESSLTAKGEEATAAAAEAEQRVRAILAKLPPASPAEVAVPGDAAATLGDSPAGIKSANSGMTSDAGELTGADVGQAAEPEPDASSSGPARWIAGIERPAARAAFLARTNEILAGEEGQAHVLNMVADGTQVPRLLPAPRIAILLEGEFVGDPMAPITDLPEQPEQAAPKEQPARPVPAEPGSPVLGKTAVKVLAAIICAGILAWVIYRVTGAGKPVAPEPPGP
jgi:hypothetical protein